MSFSNTVHKVGEKIARDAMVRHMEGQLLIDGTKHQPVNSFQPSTGLDYNYNVDKRSSSNEHVLFGNRQGFPYGWQPPQIIAKWDYSGAS